MFTATLGAMRLGVDFGTTHSVVSAVDRGNYPIVAFTDTHGDMVDHFPSVVAVTDSGLVHGFEAVAAAEQGAPALRSMKRHLGVADLTAASELVIGSTRHRTVDVVTGYLKALRHALVNASTISDDLDPEAPLITAIAVPAHAHGAQRFWTLEAFRAAGFEVTSVINEPSAAAFEYTHRQPRTLNSRRTRIVVYDLGGGTFDASLVTVDGTDHEILGSIGLNRLGGDDFDHLLAELAAATAGETLGSLSADDRRRLLDAAREAKERIAPQSRRILLEASGKPITLGVQDFYDLAADLVETTVAVMEPLLGELVDNPGQSEIAGIYLVGGTTGLPLVPRLLREHFGRRVHRSPSPMASTAIGLAIAADPEAGYQLTDRLSRGFGVFREVHQGRALAFDEIFGPRQRLDDAGTVEVTRRYQAAHNVGWFRFVEYRPDGSQTSGPTGDMVPFGDLLMPFSPELESLDESKLRSVPIERSWESGTGPAVEERYGIDENGIVTVTITNLATGHSRTRALTGDGSGAA